MTASREERTYRSSYKKCIKGETRTRLLEDLTKKRLGLRDVEEFIIRERKTFHGGGEDNFQSRIRKYEEERSLVVKIMSWKMRENSKFCIRLRKNRLTAEKALKETLGRNSRVFKKVKEDTKRHGENLRGELKEKNDKKVKWLEEKYGMRMNLMDELTEEEKSRYEGAEILKKKSEMRGEELRRPEVVKGVDEVITLTNEESDVLALGPKFCVRKHKLCEEEFEVDLEECIAKIKWGKMGEVIRKKERKDSCDVAIMAVLDEEHKDEVKEHEELEEAKMRMVFQHEEISWNFGRKRVTDLKGNNMVNLPGKLKNFQDEANLEMMRAEVKACFRKYVRDNCDEEGKLESNLTKGELRELKHLRRGSKRGIL